MASICESSLNLVTLNRLKMLTSLTQNGTQQVDRLKTPITGTKNAAGGKTEPTSVVCCMMNAVSPSPRLQAPSQASRSQERPLGRGVKESGESESPAYNARDRHSVPLRKEADFR